MTHEINIADFAAFCRSKGEERYPWCTTYDCALGQYARARFPHDFSARAIAEGTGIIVDDERIVIDGLPKGFAHDCVAVRGETGSFSALADRLEALTETVNA